jgi:hypothetical protein
MKVTQKEKKVIENYLNYYNSKFSGATFSKISFSNQMELLYDHLTHIVK